MCHAALLAGLVTLTLPSVPAPPGTVASPPRRVALPAPSTVGEGSLERVLSRRRSVRRFTQAPLSLAELGQLLWAAQGVTTDDGRRTAPSAGALYPLEVQVLAGRVAELPAGAYRYRPADHSLQLVAGEDRRPRLAPAVQGFVSTAPVVLVISGVTERTAVKYGERAERYVRLEAGCAAQGALLQAVALGLGAAAVGAFDDGTVARAAALRPEERPLLLVPVGRPRR